MLLLLWNDEERLFVSAIGATAVLLQTSTDGPLTYYVTLSINKTKSDAYFTAIMMNLII